MAQPVGGGALLSRLNAEDRSKLLAASNTVSYEGDEVILHAGENSEHFCVVMEGSVVVELVRPAFSLCVETLGPGEGFGWSSLLPGSETMFQVRTREASRIACLHGAKLVERCHATPDFGVRFLLQALDIAARRIHGTEKRLSELCASP